MAKAIDEKYLSVKVAQETLIYYISTKYEDVGKTKLLKQIMRSNEKIKINKMYRNKYNIFINGKLSNNPFAFDNSNNDIIESIEFCVFDGEGNKNCINSFENIEEACSTYFNYIYQNNYLNEDDKLKECYFTIEEAEENFYEYYAEKNNLNIDETKSILKEKWLLKAANEEKEFERIKLKREKKEEEILSYINLIDKVENETLGQTAKRLSEAIGYFVNKDILFDTTRRIRGE